MKLETWAGRGRGVGTKGESSVNSAMKIMEIMVYKSTNYFQATCKYRDSHIPFMSVPDLTPVYFTWLNGS